MPVRVIIPTYFDDSINTPYMGPGFPAVYIKQGHYANAFPPKDLTPPSPSEMLADPNVAVNVYTVEEIDGIVTGLQNADTDKATKTDLAAALEQTIQAFKSTVTASIDVDEIKAIQSKVKADLKADPDFRQEMRDEVMLELISDPDFIAQIVAKLPAQP